MRPTFHNSSVVITFLAIFVLIFIQNRQVYSYYERDGAPSSQPSEVEQKPDAKKNKTPDYKQLYDESLNWFPESTPPLIREFLKNPDNDELARLVSQYLNEIVERSNKASAKIAGENIPEGPLPHKTNIVSRLNELGRQGYTVKYFYSDTCPYCRNSEPFVKIISRFMTVERIAVSPENKREILKWRVEKTPTCFFIRDGNAYKMTGEINEETLTDFLAGLPQ